jgi:hypothetical protein
MLSEGWRLPWEAIAGEDNVLWTCLVVNSGLNPVLTFSIKWFTKNKE